MVQWENAISQSPDRIIGTTGFQWNKDKTRRANRTVLNGILIVWLGVLTVALIASKIRYTECYGMDYICFSLPLTQ